MQVSPTNFSNPIDLRNFAVYFERFTHKNE